MAADERVAQLEEFLAERGRPLLRIAALLGGGPEAGEDLLQAALERLLRRWRKFEGDLEGLPAPHALPPGRRRLAPPAQVARQAAAAGWHGPGIGRRSPGTPT